MGVEKSSFKNDRETKVLESHVEKRSETQRLSGQTRESIHESRQIAATPGASFSKVPKLFGRISGDIILSVSSKRRRLEARNLAVIFIFIPFTTYEKTSFTE